jgi:dimeric dUTPase (all-alpha-NTP-PPase superfamily)
MNRQMREMLRLQADVNSKINPNWLQASYPFLRAVLVEAAEAIDHHGWKWWSKQEPNMEQLRLELIDIWHFALSHLLIENNGDLDRTANVVGEAWTRFGPRLEAPFELQPSATLLEHLELIAGLAVARRFDVAVFRDCCRLANLSFDNLFRAYVGKNTLNHFRQDHGYKQGTYRKIWNGREDNEHLAEILSQVDAEPEQFAATVSKELGQRYDGD